MSAPISLARQRAVVDAHLVDQAAEALAPDVVGAEGQRAVAASESSPSSGLRADLGAVRRTGAASCRRRWRRGASTCSGRGRSVPRRAGVAVAEVRARDVGVAVGVERVGQAAVGLLEDHRAPVRRRPSGLHPGLERHAGRQVERRRRRARSTMSSSPSKDSARPKRPLFAARRRPSIVAVVAAALVDDGGAGGLLEAVRGDRRASAPADDGRRAARRPGSCRRCRRAP